MSAKTIYAGQALPLSLQLGTNDSTKYPLAHVYGPDSQEIDESPIMLGHIANGLYRASPAINARLGNYLVQYIVYDDPGHTTENSLYELTSEDILVQRPQFSGSPIEGEVSLRASLEGSVS